MTTTKAAPKPQADAISSELVAALERVWARIRRAHPEVPQVVLITGMGLDPRRKGLRLGHYARDVWDVDGDVRPEIFLGGEGLKRGARDVLGTLLHEAAHALAAVRDIQDTSRQGRYHNKRFKLLAEEVGISVEHDSRIGWSPTTVPDATWQKYQHSCGKLEAVLILYRDSKVKDKETKTVPPYVCDCGRKIRMSQKVADEGSITCGECGADFVREDERERCKYAD